MSCGFNSDAIDGFKAFILCGGSRDQVVREMSEYIFAECEWESGWDRSELLEKLIKIVYNEEIQ
jgi:hypothetical protein